MAFLFDPRGHHRVRKFLEGLGGEVMVTTLEAGDVTFLDQRGRTVGVELKTTDDLLSYDVAVVLPYGFLTCTKEGFCRTKTGVKEHPPWPTNVQLIGAILSLWEHGVTVLPFQPNEWMVAQVLVAMRRWFDEGVRGSVRSWPKARQSYLRRGYRAMR